VSTMRTIKFSRWGRKIGDLKFATYAVGQPGESPIEAVIRSVQRTTGLCLCGGPRLEGQIVEKRRPVATQWAMTLGRPVRGGGFEPRAELWISIPIGGQP